MVPSLTIFIILVISTTTRGVKTSCRVQVTANQQGFLICQFSKNIMTPQKHNFVVHRYDLNDNSSFQELLRCNWLEDGLDCTTLPGYSFDRKVSDFIFVHIPELTKAHEGKYVCQVLGNDMDDDECCYFHYKGELHVKSTPPAPESKEIEVTAKETDVSDSPLSVLENTTETALSSRSAVELHTHDNDTGHQDGTIQALLIFLSVCMALLMLSAAGYFVGKTWHVMECKKECRVRRNTEEINDGSIYEDVTTPFARQKKPTECGSEGWLQKIDKRVHQGINQLVDVLQQRVEDAVKNSSRTGGIDDGYKEIVCEIEIPNENTDGDGKVYVDLGSRTGGIDDGYKEIVCESEIPNENTDGDGKVYVDLEHCLADNTQEQSATVAEEIENSADHVTDEQP